MVNDLDPLEFGDGEAEQFISRFRCGICFGFLRKVDAPDFSPWNHKYNAECIEHGLIINGGAVHYRQVEKIESDIGFNQLNRRK